METPILPDKGKLRDIVTHLEELNTYREKTRKIMLTNQIDWSGDYTKRINDKYDKLSKEIQDQIDYLNTLINN